MGLTVTINPSDWSQTVIYKEIFLNSGYDLSRVPFNPNQIIDCGAHLGFFSLLATARFPEASLTLFEPNPDNANLLRQNFKNNGIACKHHLAAVGASEGSAFLDVVNSHSAHLSDKSGLPTSIINLTEFIRKIGDCRLLLKMDIEGEERQLWPELIPSLPRQTAVFFETHHGDDGWLDAKNRFKQYGFEVTRTVERGMFSDGYAIREQ